MREYPVHAERWHALADGRRVLIRPVRAEDENAERAFFGALDPESRRLRFLKAVGTLSGRLVHAFTHVDYAERMAFVCEAEEGGARRLVGEARYAAIPGTRSCDFGIVIADAWHRSGIAGLLMAALIDYARAQGFETMEGVVLAENRRMLRFVRALGFEVRPMPGDPTVRYVVKVLRSTSSASAASAGAISTG
ncbi:MAG: GNAT family N-acetyltransferase [Burkholderiales bacterium]|nr:GNAT family N-acetyltransferase [Burkholderiales bacterium]